jgi:putative ABC transport system permease protein
MTILAWLKSSSRNLFRKQRADAELDDEVRGYVELVAEEKMRAGMNPEEARRAARIEAGGVERVKEQVREVRAGAWLDSLLQDVRFGLRMLRKSPGFAAIAILTLALGIGANTAIFSVVNAILLRPLPFPDPGRLMIVWHTPPQKSFPGVSRFVVSPANYLDWSHENHVFEQMAAIGFGSFNLTGMGQPESVTGASVSADFFSVLRFRPGLGRGFVADDDRPGHGNVVVVSHAFRQTHFGANENVLGKSIKLDDKSYAIIGVMPPKFDFPFQAQLWTPLAWTDQQRAVRGNHNYVVITSLKSGVDQEKAQAEMNAISDRLAQQYPTDDAGWGASVVPLRESLIGPVRSALLVLLGAVAFVLLIACTNVANLTLAKALGRRKEIAIRTILGASRGRVVRQVLSETALLSVLGGALALLLAHFVIDAITVFIGPQLPLSVDISFDRWILAFTLGISILTGITAGLAPAWHLARTNLNASLKQGLGKTDSDSGGGRARNVFVVAEVALSLVLLVGAWLMIRTLYLLRSVNPGFDPNNVLTVPLAISAEKYVNADQQKNFFRNVLARVRALPGVVSAGSVDSLPFQGGSTQPVIAEGQPVVPMADQPEVAVRVIGPGYLRTMRIPLEQGRDIADADDAKSQLVILVSNAFARRFWPHENPIGKHVTLTFSPGPAREVVGVVGDVKLNGLDVIRPVEAIYDAMNQDIHATRTVLTVRTTSTPTSLISAVTDAVHQVDPDEPLIGVATMDSVVDQSLGQQQLTVVLLAAFAGLALLLASIGIYGLQAYAVRQRIREIGIRMALGAQRRDVFRLVVGQALKLTGLGIGIGLVGAFGITRLMASQLYGLSATDPLTFVSVAILLTLVALAACYIPARRAMRVDPMVALRYE